MPVKSSIVFLFGEIFGMPLWKCKCLRGCTRVVPWGNSLNPLFIHMFPVSSSIHEDQFDSTKTISASILEITEDFFSFTFTSGHHHLRRHRCHHHHHNHHSLLYNLYNDHSLLCTSSSHAFHASLDSSYKSSQADSPTVILFCQLTFQHSYAFF